MAEKQKKSPAGDLSSLPMNTLKEVPTPGQAAERIVGLVRKSGEITGYQLSGGRILSKEEGIDLARAGGIEGVGIATNQGTEYLKSLPDDSEQNNLGNLPTVQTDK
ncbi:MAG: DUF3892 domain-containing protein [Clostridiales bacterium]|nr:DUF3892 domain-containing protein [Clostridiales bacterium]